MDNYSLEEFMQRGIKYLRGELRGEFFCCISVCMCMYVCLFACLFCQFLVHLCTDFSGNPLLGLFCWFVSWIAPKCFLCKQYQQWIGRVEHFLLVFNQEIAYCHSNPSNVFKTSLNRNCKSASTVSPGPMLASFGLWEISPSSRRVDTQSCWREAWALFNVHFPSENRKVMRIWGAKSPSLL